MEEAVIKRIPPHNIEAERAVIGSMIMDRDAILVCSEMLTYLRFMDSTDFIRIFPVYILVYMNRINYMYKGTGKNI